MNEARLLPSVLTPRAATEVEAVARDLERFGLRRNAQRLRALLGDPPDDERPYPVQDHDAGNQLRAIPWGLAEVLYPAYGHDQTLERMGERGGFGRGELGMLAADCYGGRGRPRLRRPPLLDLYDMATRSQRGAA